jgi:mutual gliding-motility protein MglA
MTWAAARSTQNVASGSEKEPCALRHLRGGALLLEGGMWAAATAAATNWQCRLLRYERRLASDLAPSAMAHIDHSAGEVVGQIVYYGLALAGKTTNLRTIYAALATEKGPLVPFASGSERSLLFDFLPPGVERVHGMKMRVQLCTVDGPVAAEASRRALLRDADAVVFVVDSQAAVIDRQVSCLESLERILLLEQPDLPLVLQFNKRDLPTALPQDVLNQRLNRRGWPALEAIARQGIGVAETLRVAIRHCHMALAALDESSLSGSTAPRQTSPHRPELPSVRPPSAVGEGTVPLRRPTAESLARDFQSSPEKRHLTLSAMSREAFASAARRYDTIPATPRESLERPQNRYATLPATPMDELERAQRRQDALKAATSAQDDEETRPLRLSTAKSLAKKSLEGTRPAVEQPPPAPEPLEPSPPAPKPPAARANAAPGAPAAPDEPGKR